MHKPLISAEWVERAARRWGTQSATYQVRVLGDFPATATDTLIHLTQIEAAVNRTFDDDDDASEAPRPPAVMGLDVARFGDDRSVACIRRGATIIDLVTMPARDIMTTTGHALDLARRHAVCQINVDEVGIGAGVLDRMHELFIGSDSKIEAVGINGGRRAGNPERFANLRAELFDALRQRRHLDLRRSGVNQRTGIAQVFLHQSRSNPA